MKHFIIFALLSVFSINIFPQEKSKLSLSIDGRHHYSDKVEKDITLSLRFITPPPHEGGFGYLGLSAGISYGIIPEYFYIGIAGDAGIGFGWISVFSNNDNTNNNYTDNYHSDDDNNRKNLEIGLSIGGRVYNLLQMQHFRIWSFFGCDLLWFVLPMPYVGMELSYKMVGMEYAYYLPIYNEFPVMHRVSLKFRFLND